MGLSVAPMRNLIAICSLIAALYLAWHHFDLIDKKTALESKSLELTQEIDGATRELEATRGDLQAAIAQINALEHAPTPLPTPKTNWIEDAIAIFRANLTVEQYTKLK